MAEWPTNKGILLFIIHDEEDNDTLFVKRPEDINKNIKFKVGFAFQIDQDVDGRDR